MKATTILLMMLVVLMPVVVIAQTEFEGEISGEWTVDDSPYIQIGAANVPEGRTLEIQPGVTVILHAEEYLNVEGLITAEGEEDARITFMNPENEMGYRIRIESTDENACIFNYCNFNLLDIGIYSLNSNVEVENCSFTNCQMSIFCDEGEVNITNCFSTADEEGHGWMTFHGDEGSGRFSLSSTVIEGDNHITFNNVEQATIDSCIIQEIRASFNNEVNITNSTIRSASVNYSSGIVSHNNIGGLSQTSARYEITDNSMGSAYLSSFDGRIENNTIRSTLRIGSNSIADCINNNIGSIYIEQGCDISFAWNVVNGKLEITNSGVTFVNNTIYAPEEDRELIYLYDDCHLYLANNILYSRSNATYGVRSYDGDDIRGGYNCFYGVRTFYREDDPQDGDFAANPLFRRIEVNDIRLRPDSPCIDAGDPDSEEDPDRTRADIGAYYFDQRGNGPPCIISNNDAYGTIGLPFSYTAIAIDDGDEIRFEFDGLPEWLHEVDRDDIIDSVTVSGEVPEDQEEFTFLINITDDDGLEDTLTVFVGIDSLRILHGYIRGVLRREDSPFLINDTAIVAENDSLIIEPGCRLIFKPQLNGQRSIFQVFGSIYVEGTEDDSIYISRLNNDVHDGGFRLEANEGTEAVFSFCNVEYGLRCDGKDITISNCSFHLRTLGIHDAVEAIITDNSFENNTISIYGNVLFSGNILSDSRISAWNGSISIFNNEFNSGSSGISTTNARYAEIYNNYVENCDYGIGVGGINTEVDFSANVFNNFVVNCNNGISIGTIANYNVSNNVIVHSSEKAISTYNPNSQLANNVIIDSPVGIYYSTRWENEYSLDVLNNLFLDIDTLITFSHLPVRDDQYFAYNCFYNIAEFGNDFDYLGELDSVNANGDSTDSNFNLYLDPHVFNLDELDFYLFQDSPLIDAGHPDSIYFDLDGSINDIGLYGGPYGEEYDYPEDVGVSEVPVPKGFTLGRPYPNPFNTTTNFPFSLHAPGDMDIKVYDTIGRLIFSDRLEELKAGSHRYTWHGIDNRGRQLPTGIYYFELTFKGAKLVKQAVLLK
ncbi:hypothetical protein HQ587_02125 [bacterium]|nr:hypothetical protein [bacterium]